MRRDPRSRSIAWSGCLANSDSHRSDTSPTVKHRSDCDTARSLNWPRADPPSSARFISASCRGRWKHGMRLSRSTDWRRSSSRTCAWPTSRRRGQPHEPWFGDRRRSHVRLARHGARGLIPRGAAEVPGARGNPPIGLGIGRLVFRALNSAESFLAVGILTGLAVDVRPSASSWRPPSYSSPSWLNCWAYGRGWRAAPMRCWPGRMPLARVLITPTLRSRWSR